MSHNTRIKAEPFSIEQRNEQYTTDVEQFLVDGIDIANEFSKKKSIGCRSLLNWINEMDQVRL